MSTAATQQPPSIPPRPSRSQDKDAIPMIPPRPINRKVDRSVSPNSHHRYAPSPLNEAPFLSKSPGHSRLIPGLIGESIDRSRSVDIPSLGEEGNEYAHMGQDMSPSSRDQSSSPEHTRTIGEDIKLHAPKPSLPAQSAKQRVKAVTRTDSDKAASFGIGRPSSEDNHAAFPGPSLKKKPSTISQLSTTESHPEDEHGIPEIGQQVPMFPNAGDVQAPSPAPGTSGITEGLKGKHHARKLSSRALPPGSYGLHGHGMLSQDRLDKAYYEKHPQVVKKEYHQHHHDRANDFSMSSEDLNKIVRDTPSRGAGFGTKHYVGTPSDQIGWQVMEESTSRVASPRPGSTDMKSPLTALKNAFYPEVSVTDAETAGHRGPGKGEVIHVDDPDRRRSVMFSDDEGSAFDGSSDHAYNAPILAEDEVRKGPSHNLQPAVEPAPERRGSAYEIEPSSRPTSRPSSRPTSIYKESTFDHRSTPLENVEEYEPLFPEEAKAGFAKPPTEPSGKGKGHDIPSHRFPSRDIWEDAPDSVHYTADVSTPDIVGDGPTKPPATSGATPREGETAAQAFARHQEELAEMDVRKHGPDTFLPMKNTQKPLWAQHQAHLREEKPGRPGMAHRFPSRDVWEDTPDSLRLETEVTTPQQDRETESPADAKSPEVPQRAIRKTTDPSSAGTDKPSIPERPKPKQGSSDEEAASPSSATSNGPDVASKPAVPARPAKAGPTSGGLPSDEAAAPSRQKPAVPARPMGSKIAALQAGFMSDLNKKLGLGPQAPKREESAPEDDVVEEQEKAPLGDARKGRARGPQRRAPAKSPSPATAVSGEEEPEQARPTLSFSIPFTLYEVDPDEDDLALGKAKHTTSATSTSEPAVEGTEQKEGEKSSQEKKTREEEKPAESEDKSSEGKSSGDSNEASAGKTEELKTLATNTAGEPLIQETLQHDKKAEEVNPVDVEEH